MNNIALTQIGIYNTQRVTDAQSRALFIARHRQFEIIMNSLDDSTHDDCPQHHLIVAQRGMGKTTMLKRLEVELKSTPWNKRFIPILFPEEQYNIQDLSSFWLNSIDALADQMELCHDYDTVESIDNVVKNLEKIIDADERASEAYKFIRLFANSRKKRLVLLVDNLNMIFARLSKQEQHTMRSLMCENGAPIIVGASPVMINEVMNYEAPFYDSFRIQILEKLSLQEITAIIANLAELTGTEEIKKVLNKHSSRIKALYQLAGGNPRTAVILFRLLSRGFSPDINDDLEALLDDLTPVYKGRLEELSEQLLVIVDAIALSWEPVTLEQIRAITRLENGQISPQLKRLADTGWIEKPVSRQGKGGAYELTERIFNIWYLMRRSSRRHKKSIHCLSKFMEVYYSGELDAVAERYLNIPFHSAREVMTALALAKLLPDSNKGLELCSKSRNYLFEHFAEYPDLLAQFDRDDLYPKSTVDEMIVKLKNAANDNNIAEVHYIIKSMLVELFGDQVTDLDNDDKYFLTSNTAYLYWLENNIASAEETARSAIMIPHSGFHAEKLLVEILQSKEGCIDEALNLSTEMVEKSHSSNECLLVRAKVYIHRNEFALAIRDLLKIIESEPHNIDALILLANTYNKNNEFANGLKVYTQLYTDEGAGDKIWKEYIITLIINSKTEKAKALLKEFKPKHGDSVYYHFLCGQLAENENRIDSAIEYYQKCMKISPGEKFIVEKLVGLYFMQKKFDLIYDICLNEITNKNYEIAIQSGNYFAFTLKDYLRAEECYKLCLNSEYEVDGNFLLLHLYRDYIYDYDKAKVFYEHLKQTDNSASFILEAMLFELRNQNIGLAQNLFVDYLDNVKIEDIEFQELEYVLAQVVSANRIDEIVNIIEFKHLDIEMAPVYHALMAFKTAIPSEYFDTIPHEIRDVSHDVYESIQYFVV